MTSPSPMFVPRLLPPGLNHVQSTEHGGMSHVPVNLNVTGWPTDGVCGEKVNSEVGAAEATPAENTDNPVSAESRTRPVRAETRRGSADAVPAWTGGASVFIETAFFCSTRQEPHMHDARQIR